MLTGTLAARFVRGAQAQNVMAQAKHLVAYEGGGGYAAAKHAQTAMAGTPETTPSMAAETVPE